MLNTRTIRAWGRDSLSALLYAIGVTRPTRIGPEQLTILTFHRVLPRSQLLEYPIQSIAVTPDELHWILDTLGHHFTCAPLREAARSWRSGSSSRPQLAITFDDGQLDNFLHARPVLASLGMRATFFATIRGAQTGSLLWHDLMAYSVVRMIESDRGNFHDLWSFFGEPLAMQLRSGRNPNDSAARAVETAKRWSVSKRHDWLAKAKAVLGEVAPEWDGMMTASELRTLSDEGHEVGSHSRSHEILPSLDDASLSDEIVGSKAELEALTGHPCSTFCYPNGDFDARCERLVREQYEYAVTTQWGTNSTSADTLRLRRIDIVASNLRGRSGDLSLPVLAWRMSSLYSGPRS